MEWVDHNRPKRKIKRCEFCDSDVSTPYKGIHQETELINGIPTACRNNGRLNADIAYPHLDKDPKNPSIKYFVEHPETNLWWTGYKWTNDPSEAFGCDKERTADRYARFQNIENYIITEHEFVSPT